MVNSDWEFPGIPNQKIPKNSQKFQVYSQQDLEFLGILTQCTNDFPLYLLVNFV